MIINTITINLDNRCKFRTWNRTAKMLLRDSLKYRLFPSNIDLYEINNTDDPSKIEIILHSDREYKILGSWSIRGIGTVLPQCEYIIYMTCN